MKRERDLIKNTLILSFGTILPKFAGVIILPIVTAKLTRKEYGTYELITTLAALFLPIITMQIQTAVFRFLIDFEHEEKEKKIIITNALSFVLVSSAISIMVLFFLLFHLDVLTRILIVFYLAADIILNFLQQIARGFHRNKLFSVSSIIVSISNMVLVVFLLPFADMGLSGVLFSLLFATGISDIVLFCKLKINRYVKIGFFSWNRLKALLEYSWPIVPNTVSNWIINLSDRLVITAVMGLEANAVYSVANKIPNLFTSIQGTFVLAWQENASIAASDRDVEMYYTKMFDSVFRVFFAIMAWLIAMMPILFSVLIQGEYDDAYDQMPILCMALLFSAVASFVGGIYIALKKTKSIGVTTAIAAAVNLAVILILIKFVGIYAGAISTLVSYLVLALYRMKDIQKFINIRYDYVRIFFMCAILFVMSFLCYFRRDALNILNAVIALVCSIWFNKEMAKYLKYRRKQKQ